MADNITDEQLEEQIADILKDANLATTSTKNVRQKLQKHFGTDLTSKKKTIEQMVLDYVNKHGKSASEDEQSEGSDEEVSEEDTGRGKGRNTRGKNETNRSTAAKTKVWKKASSEEDKYASDDSDSEEEKKSKKRKSKKRKGSDDSDGNWGSSKKSKTKTAVKTKKAGGTRAKGRGYTRAYKLSPSLSELMGQDEMPRHEVVKRVWAIIKEKNLYDPNNKQFAICDDALLKVFGTKRFRTFGMMKYLKTHFLDE